MEEITPPTTIRRRWLEWSTLSLSNQCVYVVTGRAEPSIVYRLGDLHEIIVTEIRKCDIDGPWWFGR